MLDSRSLSRQFFKVFFECADSDFVEAIKIGLKLEVWLSQTCIKLLSNSSNFIYEQQKIQTAETVYKICF